MALGSLCSTTVFPSPHRIFTLGKEVAEPGTTGLSAKPVWTYLMPDNLRYLLTWELGKTPVLYTISGGSPENAQGLTSSQSSRNGTWSQN